MSSSARIIFSVSWEPYPFETRSCLLWPRLGWTPFVPLFVVYILLTPNIARSEPLDEKSFDTLRQTLLAYIQSEYTYGFAESNATCTFSI